MRKIKFRAWCEDEKCFFYFDPIVNACFVNTLKENYWVDWYSVIKAGLAEQYTGLHDANGREIYEGDILKTEVDAYCNWQVVDEKGGWVGRNYNLPPEHGYMGLVGRHHLGKIEVIGNIHENADLLE